MSRLKALLVATVMVASTGVAAVAAAEPAHATPRSAVPTSAAPTSAARTSATTTSAGAIQPGVPTTLTVAAGDTSQLTVDIPAGVVPTVRVTQMTPGTQVLVSVIGPDTNSGQYVDGDAPSTWYTAYGPATTQAGAGTLSITTYNTTAATLTFTLGFAKDTTVPVTLGQDVTLTFDTPGDRSLLTFDEHSGFEVSATVVSNNLSGVPADPSVAQLALALRSVYGDQPLYGDGTSPAGRRPVLRLPGGVIGSWQGRVTLLDAAGQSIEQQGLVPQSSTYDEFAALPAGGTYSFVVDLWGAAAPTFSVRLDLAKDQTLQARPGERATASWSVAQRTTILIPVRKGEHPAVDVRAARLRGDQPQVDLELFMPGNDFPVAVGSVLQPAPLWLEDVADTRLAPRDEVWRLVVTPWEDTTGSIDYVAYSVKDISHPLRLGRAQKVTVSSPNVNARMPFTVAASSTGTLHWTVTGSTFAHGLRVYAIASNVFWSFIDEVPAGATSGSGTAGNFYGPANYTLILDPVDDSTGSATVTVTVDP